jgi:hypothetical protein
MGDKPQYRLIRLKEEGKWETIGAAWIREKSGFSVSIELVRGEKIKCLMVQNEDKKQNPSSPPPTDLGDSIPF